jgi:hypothetical protein
MSLSVPPSPVTKRLRTSWLDTSPISVVNVASYVASPVMPDEQGARLVWISGFLPGDAAPA